MTITPNLVAKRLGEATPGELVRFPFRGKMVLGIVAGCDSLQIPSSKVIVVLEDLRDRPGSAAGFLPMYDSLLTETALSYGSAHIIVVHPGARVAARTDTAVETNGSLLVAGDSTTIRSYTLKEGFEHISRIIDVGSWREIPGAEVQQRWPQVAILDWELRLTPEVPLDPPMPPVFTFSARA